MPNLTRRHFFYGSLLAGAVPTGGFGSTPSTSAAGHKSVSEKLNIACIGTGTRGPQILPGVAPTENIVALCDVDENALDQCAQRYPKAAQYRAIITLTNPPGGGRVLYGGAE